MNAQHDVSSDWEYTEVQVTDPVAAIRQYRAEGWELVSVVPVPVTPAARSKPFVAPTACLPLAITVGLVMLLTLFFTFLGGRSRGGEIAISQLVQDIQAGRVTLIVRSEDSNTLTAYYGDPTGKDTLVVTSIKEPESGLIEYLASVGVPPETLANINIEVEQSSSLGNYLGIAGFCLPPILFLALVAWIGRRFLSRVQQWITLVTFRRPAGTISDPEGRIEPPQEDRGAYAS